MNWQIAEDGTYAYAVSASCPMGDVVVALEGDWRVFCAMPTCDVEIGRAESEDAGKRMAEEWLTTPRKAFGEAK